MTAQELKQTIRAEIERLLKENDSDWIGKPAAEWAYRNVLSFIDSLPDDDRPEEIEPYNPHYDETYLNEKIAKATKSWKGVDVDEFMREMRAEEVDDLEEEIDKRYDQAKTVGYIDGIGPIEMDKDSFARIARHFAEWQKKQDQKTIELAEDHAMLAGMNKMEEQMMKGAVEGEVYKTGSLGFIVSDYFNLVSYGLKDKQKVKLIIIPQDDNE